ncbi:hypothetical protein MJO29_006731, partial [Puccinia striiformis f. sp. tritici]
VLGQTEGGVNCPSIQIKALRGVIEDDFQTRTSSMANKSPPVRLSSEQKIDIIKQILKSLQKGPRIATRISRNMWDDVMSSLNYVANIYITHGKILKKQPSSLLIKDINLIVEPHDDESDQPDTMMADIAPARHNPTLPPAQVDPTPESNKAMIIIVALCIIREAKGSSEEINRLFDELLNHPETGTTNAPTTYYKRHEHTQTEIHNILLSLPHEMIPLDIHTAVVNELERVTTTKGLYTPNR